MKPLRLWPGVALLVIILLVRGVGPFVPEGGMIAFFASAAGGVLILLWWLFFSRAPWSERIGALLLIAAAAVLTRFALHPSITGGAMGYLPYVLLIVSVPPVLVVWAVLARRFSQSTRWATMAVAILLGCGVWILARTDGVKGEGGFQLTWRWRPTAEERLLAQTRNETLPPPPGSSLPETKPTPEAVTKPLKPVTPGPVRVDNTGLPSPVPAVEPVAWGGFRGPTRDSVIKNAHVNTDWNASPPQQVWRRLVGPGWSSFAVAGDLIFTQEQRGEHELVSAYRLRTGEPVWRHQDAARFYESNGGAGPRGTPTIHNGRVYTMGATGIVNALDAVTGSRLWTKNAEADTGAPRPLWGFCASPVVVGDLLVTAVSGRLAAYDLASGALRWTQKTGGGGYSSPHLATIDGVEQILLQSRGGITGVALDGKVLWEDKGPDDNVAILQPVLLGNSDLLVASGDMMGGTGVRRLQVSRQADGTWKVEERWASRGLKPYFNDYVVHKGHAFGFDGSILSAINLENGERLWKGGRYGNGQLLLLANQDLLLVIGEEGDLALVAAAPDKHTELAKFKAIEGKTWNHPVLVDDLLLVRNGEEMAAFKLAR